MGNILTSNNVTKIFEEVVSKKENEKAISCDGIRGRYYFDKDLLEKNKSNIYEMLMELPTTFRSSDGGGWSFLNACMDKDGNQWTGLHTVMEQLFVLGIAIGKVKEVLPREMWNVLPGGMPYYVVDDGF